MEDIRKYKDLKLLVISGSTQESGQSLKVARWLETYLRKAGIGVSLVDAHALDLPLIGTQKDSSWHTRWKPVEEAMAEADGLVLVSPEYNGGPSPAILNIMLYVSDQLAHKPVLPIGVSAGRGGAYPISALRHLGPKDPAYVVIPDGVIVSHVNGVLNDHGSEPNENLEGGDAEVRRRLAEASKVLLAYARALKGMGKLLKG